MTHLCDSGKLQPIKNFGANLFSSFFLWVHHPPPSSYLSLSLFVVVPHVTDAIQDWIERVAIVPISGDDQPPDICVIEVNNN